MKKNRSVLLILVIFALSVIYSAGTVNADVSTTQARPTIKIGGLGPLAITPGNDMKNGLKMAVEEINTGDGVNVSDTIYDFDLIIETTSGSLGIPDPTTGVTSAVKLILNDNVTAIIGGFRTEVVLGIQLQPLLLDRPFLGIGASAPIVSPHFWRIGPGNVSGLYRNIVDLYAYGLIPDMGVRNITIIRESAAWTLSMSNGIKQTMAYLKANLPPAVGGFPVVNFTDDIVIDVTSQQDDVTTAMTGLTADTVDGLQLNALLTIFSGPVGRYVPVAWHALDLPQFLAGINVESQVSTFFDESEGACYGEIELETCPLDMEPMENTASFRTNYFAEYDEMPTYTAFSSYDAVYLLKAAIEEADSLKTADIETVMKDIEFNGTAYTIKFTSEAGPHWTVVEDPSNPGSVIDYPILKDAAGNPVDEGTFDVHDLYTTGTFGTNGRPYTIGYWAQWQKDGVKKTIWHNETGWTTDYPMTNTRNITKSNILWPIDHDEHGWTPAETSEETLTTGATTETEPTEGSTVEVPGFELQISLFILFGLTLVFYRQKQKKR